MADESMPWTSNVSNVKRSSSIATFMLLIGVLTSSRTWMADGFSLHILRKPQSLETTCLNRIKESQRTQGRLWMTGAEGGNQTVMFGASTASETDVELEKPAILNGDGKSTNGASSSFLSSNGASAAALPDWLQERVDQSRTNPNFDVPRPTENGGYSHTSASKAKISAANKGKVPWNKGKGRSEEVKARIAAGVRKRNREKFLRNLQDMGITEEEYNAKQAQEKAKKKAETEARRTEKGGYRPTEETKKKISQVLKSKWANGEVKKRVIDPSKVRRGFKHSEETRAKISASLKERWANDEDYRTHMMNKTNSANTRDEVRQRISDSLKKKWEDPVFRANMTAKIASRKRPAGSHGQSHREKISAAMKAKWKDEAYRKRATEAMARRAAELAKSRPPRVKKPKPSKKVKTKPIRVKSVGPTLAQPMSQPKKVKGVKRVRRMSDNSDSLRGPDPTLKKRKKTVKKTKKVEAAKDGDDATSASSSSPAKATKSKKKSRKKKDAPGSVTRLREERRDLYDLLYGDEDEPKQNADAGSVLPTDGNSALSSVFLGDEDLDEFDPYGLEDF